MVHIFKNKIISILFISMISLIIAFISLFCAYAMCPTSFDIALAQDSNLSLNSTTSNSNLSDAEGEDGIENKNTSSDSNLSATNSYGDEPKYSSNAFMPTNNLNADSFDSSSTSRSFAVNLTEEDSYTLDNNNFCLTMHYSELQKYLRNKISNSQKKFLKDKIFVYNDSQLSNEGLEKFDLRNMNGKNYVSNVKCQDPFGTCWAFAITAASEISLQSKSNTSYKDNPIDLSNHHLSWFANNHIPVSGEAGYDPNNSQAGEGGWYLNPTDKNASMNCGGLCYYGINSFSSFIGAQKESNYPYRGIIGRVLAWINNKYKIFDSYNEAIEAGAEPIFYSDDDDWSIDEEARFTNEYYLEESNVLPNVRPVRNDDGQYVVNTQAINIVKDQLFRGKGVAISLTADTSFPTKDESMNTDRYLNTTSWAHYTWKDDPKEYTNHCVCIVGFDDNYDRNNFTIDKPAKWDTNQNPIYKLNGMNLNNNEEGNPYYTKTNEGKTVQVVLDKDSPLIELQPGSTKDYKLKDTELKNNNYGEPLYPNDSGILMPDVSILCEVARDNSGSHTPAGNGAWICKNSWGASSQPFPNNNEWGIDGYFYLSYYDLSIDELISYELNEKDNSFDNDLIYAYDYMPDVNSSTGYFLEDNYSGFKYLNVFTATDNTLIDSVSCITDSPSTKCQVSLYLLNDDATNPQDGQMLAQTEEEFFLAGFHKINLNEPILVHKNKKFSVVICELTPFLDAEGNIIYYQSMPVPMNNNIESVKEQGEGVYYKSVINPGESFVTYYDKNKNNQCCYDLKDFINTSEYNKMTSNLFDDDTNRKYYSIDNFPVKAYGTTASNPSPSPTNDDSVDPKVTASTSDSNMFVCVFLMLFLILGAAYARFLYCKDSVA